MKAGELKKLKKILQGKLYTFTNYLCRNLSDLINQNQKKWRDYH
jgi:hypothetical protein